MSETRRICGECGARADYVIEPVGRYDFAGWADTPACTGCVGAAVLGYIADDMQRVQVRYVDVPAQPEPSECCCEGCDTLVAEGDGSWCLNCERDITSSIAAGTVTA